MSGAGNDAPAPVNVRLRVNGVCELGAAGETDDPFESGPAFCTEPKIPAYATSSKAIRSITRVPITPVLLPVMKVLDSIYAERFNKTAFDRLYSVRQ